MLSRTQQAVLDFDRMSDNLRRIADDRHGTGLMEFTEAFVQSISCFGISELNARQAERDKALALRDARLKSSIEASGYYNEKGIRLLSGARGALKQFREELASFPKDLKLSAADIKATHQEIRDAVAELEIKATDAEKINAVFTKGFELLSAKGALALPDYLEEHIADLERIRRQPDRGAVENIPVWKVAAIVVAFGVWIWTLFRCKWWGSCSLKEGLAYATIFWIAALISRFC